MTDHDHGTEMKAESNVEESEVKAEGAEGEEPAVDDSLFLSPDDSEGEEEVFELDGESAPEAASAPAPEPAPAPAAPEPAAASPEPVAAAPVDSARVSELEARVAELEGKSADLEQKVSDVETERDEFKNRMLRVAADLENFRKRTLREKEEMRKYGIDKVVLELLPVIDNLERALHHSGENADAAGVVDGVRMVTRQFMSALEKHGVKGFESKGEHFDPQRHEAIQQLETPDHETGTVLEQYQKGYFLHERLIRPALVSVAKKIDAPVEEEAEDESVEAVAADEGAADEASAPESVEAAGAENDAGSTDEGDADSEISE